MRNSKFAVAEHTGQTTGEQCHFGRGEPQQGFEQRGDMICKVTKAEAGRNGWGFSSVFLTFHNGHMFVL